MLFQNSLQLCCRFTTFDLFYLNFNFSDFNKEPSSFLEDDLNNYRNMLECFQVF